MDRVRVDLFRGADLSDLPEVHDGNAIRDVADDAEVVRHEDVGEAELALQVAEQVDDLCLHRYVESGDGLVGDDQLGLQRKRPSDADALALTAGELVGVAVEVLGGETHPVEKLLDLGAELLAVGDAVELERIADDLADALPGIERGVGVLKDHLHVAPQRPQGPLGELGELDALELDRPGSWLEELKDRAGERRLAASGLADEAERLALGDGERDPVHRLHCADLAIDDHAGLDREVLRDVLHFEERARASSCGRCLQADIAGIKDPERFLLLAREPAAIELSRCSAALREVWMLRALTESVRAARPELASLGRVRQ